ncbi:MAG: hypothetical protein ACXWP5_11615 [Bdellovibrionota bacterium]
MQWPKKNLALAFGIAGLLIGGFVGCNDTAYIVTKTSFTQRGPGNFYIPPKVDLLIVEDDSTSMQASFTQIKDQFPAFLTKLDNEGWDYHFAVAALGQENLLTAAVGSHYDSNWGSAWTPPYPGASAGGPGTLAASVFQTPAQYQGFLGYNDMSRNTASDQGLADLVWDLQVGMGSSNFIRSDAMLVVLIVTNGEDVSGLVNSDFDYTQGAHILIPYTANYTNTLNTYLSQIKGVKSNPGLARVYSAVATQSYTSCLGSTGFAGVRYSWMAQYTGGKTYDICSTPISTVLDSLSKDLQGQLIGYHTRYIPIAGEPDPATISVIKYSGGSKQTLPQDASNGWTYAGNLPDSATAPNYAIDYPTPMNKFSGYAIELHGSAKLVGDDTADVSYKIAGWKNTSQ